MFTDVTDHPWLKEVHSKIWNRKDLKPQLFREVKVTRGDYAALQERLKELHPDRDSPDYDGSKSNVRDVKLDFLRALPDLPPSRHPDDNDDRMDDDDDLEASNEDDPDIEFPSTLRYLDLSILELKTKVSTRFPLPLLIRQEYDYISELISKRPQSSMGSMIVSSQPGTGKTAYLYLRMIENMIEGRPFLHQTMGGTVYHVDKKGVEMVYSWPSRENITAFVDGDKGDYGPQGFLFDDFVQLVVASPRKGAYQKWTTQTGYRSLIFKLVVKLWSLNELLLTGTFLYPLDISFKLLRESTSYFGYNPRQCFEASLSVNVLDIKKTEVMNRIKAIAVKGSDHTLALVRMLDFDVSDAIFQISPYDNDKFPNLARCKFEAVSGWALDVLLQELEYNDRHANDAADFYRRILMIPEAESLQGLLFERQVLKYLSGGIQTEPGYPIIRRLIDSAQETWTSSRPFQRITIQESTILYDITEAIRNRRPVQLVPLVRNFEAVDSILIDMKDPSAAAITCIQLTMNKKDHAISVSDLQHIQSWLEPGFHAEKGSPWRFIYIVPKGTESTFKLQRMDGETGCAAEWAGKVDQFVVGLEDHTIFGRFDSRVQRGSGTRL